MNEQEMKYTQDELRKITQDLKSHYFFNEFFVDPEKKFIGLLEKIIKFFEDDDFIVQIKQNEHLYINFKQKYECAMDLVKSIEEEKDKLEKKLKKKKNGTEIIESSPLNKTDISTDSVLMDSPRISSSVPWQNYKRSSEFSIASASNIVHNNKHSTSSQPEIEKLKEEYFSLYDEKKNIEHQLYEYMDSHKKFIQSQEIITDLKSQNENMTIKIKKLLEENSNFQEKIFKMSRDHTDMVKGYNSLKESLDFSEKEKISSKNKFSLNQSKAKGYEKEINNLRKKNQSLNNQIKDLTEKLKDESDDKLLLEKKMDDIQQEYENKLIQSENDKQKIMRDTIGTLIKAIQDEECMEFSYNKENNKIEIYFDKEKIAEVSNRPECDSPVMKTENSLSPCKAKIDYICTEENLTLNNLFSHNRTKSSFKSYKENKENSNIMNILSVNRNSNGNSYKARVLRQDSGNSRKAVKNFEDSNPFDYFANVNTNTSVKLENCIKKTNINNSLRYVLSSSNHNRTKKKTNIISLDMALGMEDNMDVEENYDYFDSSIKKLNFLSSTQNYFEIFGDSSRNPCDKSKYEIGNFDMNFEKETIAEDCKEDTESVVKDRSVINIEDYDSDKLKLYKNNIILNTNNNIKYTYSKSKKDKDKAKCVKCMIL